MLLCSLPLCVVVPRVYVVQSAMRSRWKWWAAAVLLLALAWRDVFAVTLNKCCDIGLALQHPDASCKSDIYEEDWIPLIYASNPQGGFYHTALPQNWTISAGTRPVCNNGHLPTLIRSPIESPVFILLDNESLSLLMLHHSDETSPPLFAPDAFCVDRQTALVCDAPSQEGIRKCCGPNAAYSETNASCVHGEKFNSDEINKVASASGFPICHNGPSGIYIVAGNVEGNLTAVVDKENGGLQLAPPPSAPLDVEEYCIERVVERPHSIGVFVCAPPIPERTPIRPEDHSNDVRFTLYPAGLAISAFFLAATLATGCLLPKAHHALHWRCQTCHVACLLVGDVLLATVQLAGAALPAEACKIMGKLKYTVTSRFETFA